MTFQEDFLQLADHLLLLLHETAVFHEGTVELGSTLRRAWRLAAITRCRLDAAGKPHVLAVVGLGNVGKSTLVNALFEMELAPRRNGPCTAVPVEFRAASGWGLEVHYREEFSPRRVACKSLAEMHQCLNDVANDAKNANTRSIARIAVTLEHPLLRSDFVIADTPGFGAAQPGEAAGSHEKALLEYLNTHASQVFWVALADQGIGQREYAFYEQNLSAICDDVVVTGCEDWSESDSTRFTRRFSRVFGRRVPTFHFVSSTEKTGICELRGRIAQLADPTARVAIAAEALLQLSQDLGAWLAQYAQRELASTVPRWRPDSWQRFLAAPDCQGLRTSLVRHLE